MCEYGGGRFCELVSNPQMPMARIAKKDIISSITREQHFHGWGNSFRYSEHAKGRRACKWLSVGGYQFFSLWHVLYGHVENPMFNAYRLRRCAGGSSFIPGVARHTVPDAQTSTPF